jgi:hypothetical protein
MDCVVSVSIVQYADTWTAIEIETECHKMYWSEALIHPTNYFVTKSKHLCFVAMDIMTCFSYIHSLRAFCKKVLPMNSTAKGLTLQLTVIKPTRTCTMEPECSSLQPQKPENAYYFEKARSIRDFHFNFLHMC